MTHPQLWKAGLVENSTGKKEVKADKQMRQLQKLIQQTKIDTILEVESWKWLLVISV